MNIAARDRDRMVHLLEEIGAPEGARPSLLPTVLLLRTTRDVPPVPVLYEPCMVFVAQGVKRFHLPDRIVSYDENHHLLLTIPSPADCETKAGARGPFLGVAVRIDLLMLGDLLMQMEPEPRAHAPRPAFEWISAPAMNPVLAGTVVRLLECLRSPADARVLGPLLLRELTYRILQSEGGMALKELLQVNTARTKIHRILHRMHSDYASPLDVPSLAREAGMSVSALFWHFKVVTASSPLQYLKTIRLHKARTLMVQDSLNAAVAGRRVGYDSPSQFSREFKRMFDAPPAEEAERVRSTFGIPT